MSEHTPGPWHYQEESDAYTHIVRSATNFFICQLQQDTGGFAEANARLIAAAPDMLSALKGLLIANAMEMRLPQGDIDHVNDLIDKAEGRG